MSQSRSENITLGNNCDYCCRQLALTISFSILWKRVDEIWVRLALEVFLLILFSLAR